MELNKIPVYSWVQVLREKLMSVGRMKNVRKTYFRTGSKTNTTVKIIG
jgi:hypothetical protein